MRIFTDWHPIQEKYVKTYQRKNKHYVGTRPGNACLTIVLYTSGVHSEIPTFFPPLRPFPLSLLTDEYEDTKNARSLGHGNDHGVTATMSKAKPPQYSLQHLLLILGTLTLIAGLIGTTFFTLKEQRENTLANVKSNLEDRTLSLVNEGNQLFRALDMVLSSIADYAARERVNNSESYKTLMSTRDAHILLRERLAGMPQVDIIGAVDVNGRLLSYSQSWPTPNLDFRDRDYFQALKAGPTLETFISKPMQNRATGIWTIFVVRRLNDPDGGFMGLLAGGVTLQYFNNLYQSTTLGEGSGIALMRRDGIFLAGYPQSGSAAKAFVETQTHGSTSPITAAYGRVSDPTDGSTHWASVRLLADYPLAIVATQDERAALRNWEAVARLATLITSGGVTLILAGAFAITRWWRQQARLTHALSESEHQATQKSGQLETTLANISHALSMFDGNRRLVVCNEQLALMYGLEPKQITPGMPFQKIVELQAAVGRSTDEQHDAYISEQIHAIAEQRNQTQILSDGRIIAVSHRRLASGGWVSTHTDITESENAQAQIRRMAHFDELTGLGNRALFLTHLNSAFTLHEMRDLRFNLLFLDLDHFKNVNDTLGHPAGDELLKQVSERIRCCTRQNDVAARFGGDEFAISQIVRGDQKEAATILAERLLHSIIQPYDINGNEVVVGTSIGIAMAPRDGTTSDALMKNADLALYQAKGGGRNGYRFFNAEMGVEARDRHHMEMELRSAIPHGDFVLAYQPVVDIATGSAVSFEALLRWQHPRRGLIMPDDFIPQAEESGLVVQLGEWVLKNACREMLSMAQHLKLAVNLSAVQFHRGNLSEIVKGALDATGFPPERLELEITETVLLERKGSYLKMLEQLKAIGVSIVLDDFGTGYSSLSYLRMFPFDKIKIDKSFVNEVSTRRDCAAIVCAVVGLARELGMQTTAEGVETAEQLLLLRAVGCTFAQGYLFGRPAAIDQVVRQVSMPRMV